jgi:UDP-N-acetylmuramate dehydrogenase
MDMAEPKRAGLEAPGELRRDEPMSRHTSWRAGGSAERTFRPRGIADLCRFLRSLPRQEPLHFVGLGSNLLVRDGGVRGTVVFTHGLLKRIELVPADGPSLVYAEAGVASPKVSRFAATHDLRGAEFLAGIPGTIGGALAMNAGCYGAETWDVVERVLTVSRDGVLRRRTPAEYDIGYRHVELRSGGSRSVRSVGSGLAFRPPDEVTSRPLSLEGGKRQDLTPAEPTPAEPAEFFLAAWLRFTPGDGEEARRLIKQFLQKRIASQPLEQPNAGSVFRNPANDYAARLIEACGLKGFAIGGAMVSPKHANFIVNTGSACAADIEALIEHVQRSVRERTGIALEREVRIIGERS